MSNEPHVTIEFRRYLLGELPEPARTAFEEAYFSDPELMEEIWAAETDLVDAYVTNRLDGDERRLFESRYLTSPQRRERVAVARALHDAAKLPFLEVYVDCPIDEAEKRDPKGLYKKARAGQLKGFTGIDDPYEAPLKPELHLRTDKLSVAESVQQVLSLLEQCGVLSA